MLNWEFLCLAAFLRMYKKNSGKLRDVSGHSGKIFWLKEWQPSYKNLSFHVLNFFKLYLKVLNLVQYYDVIILLKLTFKLCSNLDIGLHVFHFD